MVLRSDRQQPQEGQQLQMQLGLQVGKLSEGQGVLQREGPPATVEPGPIARLHDDPRGPMG